MPELLLYLYLSESYLLLIACVLYARFYLESIYKFSSEINFMFDKSLKSEKGKNVCTLSNLFFLDSTGINWKLWTILQSWLCFHQIVLLHGTNIVFIRGNKVKCNNTIMWKHNQLCNIVQSFQFMPIESKQNN